MAPTALHVIDGSVRDGNSLLAEEGTGGTRSHAEADVGHASDKVRRGEQITRHGAALSTYRGNEPADQIGGSAPVPYVRK